MFKAVIPFENEKGIVLVKGIPFGDHNQRDVHGQYFSQRTNFLSHILPLPPVFHFHGAKSGSLTDPVAETLSREQRSDGVYYKVRLFLDGVKDSVRQKANELWEAAKSGDLYASSGAVEATIKIAETGEILQWLVGELSLINNNNNRERPANFHATVIPLKADLDVVETGEVKIDQINFIYPDDDREPHPTEDKLSPPEEPHKTSDMERIKMDEETKKLIADLQKQAMEAQATLATLQTELQETRSSLTEKDSKIAQLQNTISAKSAEVAMTGHTALVDNWISDGKITPAQRDKALDLLSYAYQADTTTKSENARFVESVKGFIEAAPALPAYGTPSGIFTNTDSTFNHPGGGVDPSNIERMKRYQQI